ncbi:Dps family protein [Albidovulum sp.]
MSKRIDIAPRDDRVKTGVTDAAAVAEGLSGVLGDTYRLVFKTHAYHWNVEGPLFYGIHNLTEAQYEDMFAAADALAERIRALGRLAPSQLAEIMDLSAVKDRDSLPSALEMCADLAADHERVAKRLHRVIELAEKHADPVTADLATARSAFHENAAWMLRAVARS